MQIAVNRRHFLGLLDRVASAAASGRVTHEVLKFVRVDADNLNRIGISGLSEAASMTRRKRFRRDASRWLAIMIITTGQMAVAVRHTKRLFMTASVSQTAPRSALRWWNE